MGVVAVVRPGLGRDVGGGQGLYDLAVQDAEGDASQCVLEVVLGGQAVIDAGVRLRQGLQQDAVASLQHLFVTIQLHR